MKLLLQSIKIIDPTSSYNGKVVDVKIIDGKISEIAVGLKVEDSFQVFRQENACISSSLVDMNMHIFEPGLEYREDLKSGLKAAAKGGFGKLAMMPNTNPPIDNKTQVEFLKTASQNTLSNILPIGCISNGLQGKDLSEMYDMTDSGALAFADGFLPVMNAGLMEKALLYVKKIDGLVMSYPQDENIANGGQMNEGVNSTVLGMPASPILAEELMVARDLFLLKHTNSRLHFIAISSKKSVDLIREAKQQGLSVTANVNVANLILDDSELLDYNTNFKVQPPLRTKADIEALLTGLKDGTIDCISSGHTPLHVDEKKVEFGNAEFGMSTIDCALSVARLATKNHLSEEELITKFTNGYAILNQSKPKLEEGASADFSVFNLTDSIMYDESTILSKGKNNPFVGRELLGKSFGIINGTKTNIL